MKPHVDEFCSIVLDLQNIEVSLDDEEILLLCSLPISYNRLKKPCYMVETHCVKRMLERN